MSSAVARLVLLPVILGALAVTLGVPGFGRLVAPRFAAAGDQTAIAREFSFSLRDRDADPRPIAATRLALVPRDGAGVAATPATDVTPSLPAVSRHDRLFTSLAASFVGVQVLDVHSTLLAIDRGADEANPVMAPFASHPAALIAVKAGAAGGILFMVNRIHARNRLAGVLMMAAANSAYATVVANNYRLARLATR